MSAQSVPAGWNSQAHAEWLRGKKQDAINSVLGTLNASQGGKPLPQVLQLAYYLFLIGDFRAAAQFLQLMLPQYPDNPELLRNLGVCLTRSGLFEDAVVHLKHLVVVEPADAVAWDSLAHALHRLGRFGEAAHAGTTALHLKDSAIQLLPEPLPAGTPQQWLSARNGRDTIAFSLWGSKARYLRGALDNALAGPVVYPGWVLRFYVDDTVPAALLEALTACRAELVMEPPGQRDRMRLGWRFKVANDLGVNRFLVRDVDSVINTRERGAVDAWQASDYWFHVMRDWWTHTDLMLAGMWGGVAGVLPPLAKLLEAYRPATMETPNVDQWFLRDQVWATVRQSCLVHDRCFDSPGANAWPADAMVGNVHVGQDVYAVDPQGQATRLGAWLQRLPCLQG